MRSALLTLLLTTSTLAQSIDTATVDRLMHEAMTQWHVPGAAVAIVKDERVVYLKGFGVREAGSTAPVTADTLFQIASASKAFTTTAMAILVDEKKMEWDDPVRKYIGYFRLSDPCADSMVTLRDIVSHRTGLSRHDALWDYTPYSREDILHRVSSIKLSKQFRSAYQYQNMMFMAAGEAVTSAARVPWEDFVRTRVFEPVGMKNTVIGESDWQRSVHASGHSFKSTTGVVSLQNSKSFESLGGAGLIKSSARDMAQWIRLQLNEGTIDGRRIVSAEALGETHAPQTLLVNDRSTRDDNPMTNINAYGLGWRVQDYRGELLVSHGGALNGFRTQVDLLPKQKVGFVVLVNAGRGYATVALRNALADLLLATKDRRDWNAYYLALDASSRAEDDKKKAERAAKRHLDTKPSRELQAYAGTYSNPAYGTANVTVENGQLKLQWQQLLIPMTHYHFDTFSAVVEDEDIDEQVVFTLKASGDVKSMSFLEEEWLKDEVVASAAK